MIMAEFQVYTFPNVFLGMGVDNEFVRDLQRGLGIEPSGVFDFLTMCYVVCHKHKRGLNHEEPIVDRETWDSIFSVDSSVNNVESPELQQEYVDTTGSLGAASTSPRPDVTDDNTTTAAEQEERDQATTGIPPQDDAQPAAADDVTGTDTADNTVSTYPANTDVSTAPTTDATDENAPAAAQPDTDTPVTDANTTTAEEQQAAGAPTPNTTGQAEPTDAENPTV